MEVRAGAQEITTIELKRCLDQGRDQDPELLVVEEGILAIMNYNDFFNLELFLTQSGFWGFGVIIFRPFKAGDYIEGAGVAGTVEEIHIFATQLKTPDNKTIIVPNAKMMGTRILSSSTERLCVAYRHLRVLEEGPS